MPSQDWQQVRGKLLLPRGESTQVFSPETVAGRIKNMELTPQGTLRSVVPPTEYHPSNYENGSSTSYTGPYLGIYHCRLQGGKRDVLLAHFANHIWVHDGWTPGWRKLLGLVGAQYTVDLIGDESRARWNTQFECVGDAVIITPQGNRSFIYDGDVIMPLGYAEAPAAPVCSHATSSFQFEWGGGTRSDKPVDNANAYGYVMDASRLPQCFGNSKLGTVRAEIASDGTVGSTNKHGGVLEQGTWLGGAQYIDHFGNLSPISALTAGYVSKTDNLDNNNIYQDPQMGRLRQQLLWSSISKGRDGTIGRILLRSKDQQNSGIPGLFEVPNTAAGGAAGVATLPDNTVDIFPDNVPDEALVLRATEVVPVPNFRLLRHAFGRLWIANWAGGEGLVRCSMPGRFGTFEDAPQWVFRPDPAGGDITGLWSTAQGLLVTTATSVFLIVADDSGTRFRVQTLSRTQGCIAPDSFDTLPNGLTVWLGRNGFYGYDGERVQRLGMEIQDDPLRRINWSRTERACAAVSKDLGEYRCFVPVDGSRFPNLGLVFDGNGWRERNDVAPRAVCTTQDTRGYMLALGTAFTGGNGTSTPSVWVMDRYGSDGSLSVDRPTAVFETSWLGIQSADTRKTFQKLTLFLRETSTASPTVTVFRDWREHPGMVQTDQVPVLYSQDDTPPFWGTTLLGSDRDTPLRRRETIAHYWTVRRPYWTEISVYAPSSECLKVRLEVAGDFEIIGCRVSYVDGRLGSSPIQTGGR